MSLTNGQLKSSLSKKNNKHLIGFSDSEYSVAGWIYNISRGREKFVITKVIIKVITFCNCIESWVIKAAIQQGFVAALKLCGLLIRLGDPVAVGHPELGEAIQNGTTN